VNENKQSGENDVNDKVNGVNIKEEFMVVNDADSQI
jgi:hypothetical protein